MDGFVAWTSHLFSSGFRLSRFIYTEPAPGTSSGDEPLLSPGRDIKTTSGAESGSAGAGLQSGLQCDGSSQSQVGSDSLYYYYMNTIIVIVIVI